jgi:Macrocin-O-methyltransferase (TylF)
MPVYYRAAPGAFASWGTGADPRVGHADRPFDRFEVSPDLVGLLARFSEWRPDEPVLDELGLRDGDREAVTAALATLADAGILLRAGAPVAEPLRDPAWEAPRAVSACPDIEAMDAEFIRLYRRFCSTTLTSVPIAYALRTALRHVHSAGIAGAVVECGVWRGGSMALAAATLLELGEERDLWLYDTFGWRWELPGAHDGFVVAGGMVPLEQPVDPRPRPDSEGRAESEGATSEGAESEGAVPEGAVPEGAVPEGGAHGTGTSAAEVLDLLTANGYPAGSVRLVPGLVQDTLPLIVPDRIAVLRLDTDLYESTLAELEHLYPRLAAGGVLIIDDYGKVAGATRATDEFVAGLVDPPLLQRVDTQGRVGVKP